MRIRLSYEFDLDSFESFFPDDDVKVFDWEDDKDQFIDLMIFPGGVDVQIDWYEKDKEKKDTFIKWCCFDKKRDEHEKNIFDAIMKKELNVNKILGVCRGVQFINVMFGGYLYADLNVYGIRHGDSHYIKHQYKSNLQFLQIVNSLHHQGVKSVGTTYKPLKLSVDAKIIATDLYGQVKEIVTWMNQRILGIQFHPEYYAESREDKKSLRNFIRSWASGEAFIY